MWFDWLRGWGTDRTYQDLPKVMNWLYENDSLCLDTLFSLDARGTVWSCLNLDLDSLRSGWWSGGGGKWGGGRKGERGNWG